MNSNDLNDDEKFEDPLAMYLNPQDDDVLKIANDFLNTNITSNRSNLNNTNQNNCNNNVNSINNFYNMNSYININTSNTNNNIDNINYIDKNNCNNISIYLLREKLQKISSSLQALNMNKKINQFFNYSEMLNVINNMSENLYSFTLNLFELVAFLICKFKDEYSSKEEAIFKLNNLDKNINDYEKKIIKYKKELAAKEREINSIINKNNIEKEKIQYNKKNVNKEISDLQTENKKLNNLINLYKNEIRKKENDFNKIQEKYRTIIIKNSSTSNSSNNNNSNNNVFNSYNGKNSNKINNCNNINTLSEIFLCPELKEDFANNDHNENNLLENLTNAINNQNNKLFNNLTKENKCLVKWIKYMINFMCKCYDLIKSVNYFRENLQYIHLTEGLINNINLSNDEFLKDFDDSFTNDIEYISKFIYFLIEQYKHKPKENILDYLKNNNDIIINNNTNSNSKWFNHPKKNNKVSYQYEADKVILCERSFDEDDEQK